MNLASQIDDEREHFTWLVDVCQDKDMAVSLYQIFCLANGPATSFAEFLAGLAEHCLLLYQGPGDPVYIERGIHYIAAAKDAIGLTRGARRQVDLRIYDVEGRIFLKRFERFGSTRDLKRACIASGLALEYADGNDSETKAALLNNLGNALRERFIRLGDVTDIENSISRFQQAVELIPDGHVDRPARLSNLGLSLLHRFERLEDMADMNKAILTLQQAAELMPDDFDDKPSVLNNLGISLLTRFERLEDIADLDNAILVHEKSVNLTPNGHIDIPPRLSNLGNSQLARFERTGNVEDLDNAVLRHQQAVDLTPDGHPDKLSRLQNLSNSLEIRFQHLGKTSDITNAVLMLQQVVGSTPDGQDNKPSLLNSLGLLLMTRFEWLGDIKDIDNSILKLQQAVNLTSDEYVNKPSWLNNLGIALLSRFKRLGDLVDIDNAILRHQQALNLARPGHTDLPSWLNSFGNSLLNRFQRLGDFSDINDAISKFNRAIGLTSDGHADKPMWMNNLGISFQARFYWAGDIEDINKSILVLQKAVELTPDGDPDKPARLSNLANSLQARFKRLHDVADMDEAIIKHKKALDLTPDGHPDKPGWLNNLGASLQGRFRQSGDIADIDNSILRHQQALDLLPDGHVDKPAWLNNLGIALNSRFKHLGKPEDHIRFVSSIREAALSSCGHPSSRWEAARIWARSLHPELEPYHTMIALIPQLVWLGRTIEQRYKDLETLGDAVMDAVSAACEAGAYDLALEWIEQGRAIIWGQILRLRSPMDGLQATHPELANEIYKVASALEAASAGKPKYRGKSLSPEIAAQEHRRLAEKWELLLKKVRELPEFNDFLQHKSALALKKASANGTVIIVNVSRYRCDALILTRGSNTVDHLHLPTLSLEKVDLAYNRLYTILRESGVRVRDTARGSIRREMQSAIPNVLQMLWTDATKPILDHLGYNTPPPTDTLPHITWCLTGSLATLPLHAAGIYNSTSGNDKLFNYVVSSYAPSLTSLIAGNDHKPISLGSRSLLAITQQDTPDFPLIPGTMREVDQVKTLMEKHCVQFTRMDGHQATLKSVSEGMNSHSWIHLSCHGQQNPVEPIKSAFFLHDGALELAEIMTKPLKHAELAYLSACQTASGDARLPDEAIHLAAGMFVAGYRSVIGTLWSIQDNDAPLVAEVFYDQLLRHPDGGVAQALHEAVAALREKVGENGFVSWVPYIHIGH